MNEALEAIKRLKWGLDITQEERIELCECIEKALKEHEQHKAIEEELGIDLKLLPTLLKIKEGDKIYVIDGTLVKAEVTGNSLVNGRLMVFSHYGYKGIMYTPVCYYSEYGKTWALTREELEK